MSDIWDEFEKIAVAQGLVSEAEEEEKKEKPKTNRSGLSEDAIRFLYGIEPESIFDKRDLVEVAHPETYVAMPAYDAMNGVVENLNQRHDIMTYIATKMPNGNITQRRYVAAKNELMNSLVRTAFALDNKNEVELMILADTCANNLDKKKIVNAQAQFIIPANLLLSALNTYYSPDVAQNVTANSVKVLQNLKPLADKPYAQDISQNISTMVASAKNIDAIKSQLASDTNPEQLKPVVLQIQKHIILLNNVLQNKVPEWINKIKITTSANQETNPSWFNSITSVFNSDEETLINSLTGLSKAIANEIKVFAKILAASNPPKDQELSENTVPSNTPALPNFSVQDGKVVQTSLNAEITKQALAPMAIAAIVAGAAVVTTFFYTYYGATTAQNVYINSNQVLQDLNNLPAKPYTAGIRKDVSNIMLMAKRVYALKDQLVTVQSVDENMSEAEKIKKADKLHAINAQIGAYIEQINKVYAAIPGWVGKIKTSQSTSTEVESDWWAKITGLFNNVYNTPEDNLINDLYGKNYLVGQYGGLYEAIKKDIQNLNAAINSAQQVAIPTPTEGTEDIQTKPSLVKTPEQKEKTPETTTSPLIPGLPDW